MVFSYVAYLLEMCYLAQVFLSIFDGGRVSLWRDELLHNLSVDQHLVRVIYCCASAFAYRLLLIFWVCYVLASAAVKYMFFGIE